MADALLALLFGTFVGSFLNVCIHRLPRNESIVSPPSRCYSCGTRVAWYDNLPVLSWLILRGRCRWCGAPFSVRYLLIEALVGALTAGVVWLAFVGYAHSWCAPWLVEMTQRQVLAQGVAAAVILALVYYLVVATFTDLEHMIIPDELTKSFQLAAPLLACLCGSNLHTGWLPLDWLIQEPTHLAPQWKLVVTMLAIVLASAFLLAISLPLARTIYSSFVPEGQRWRDDDHRGFAIGVAWFIASLLLPTLVMVFSATIGASHGIWMVLLALGLAQALLGGLVGWGSLYVVGLLGTIAFRRSAMGFGDVKFLAPIGCFLGPVGVLYAFFVAALIGCAVGIPLRLLRSQREIPFGPYLAAGALVVLAVGPQLHNLLMHLVG